MSRPASCWFRLRRATMLASLGVLLGVASSAHAQEAAKTRPRIGLVLSGGGARGAAHVGVLEVLEELRVPVDHVVGTSMGAIVGGLYAYGLSPAQLRELLIREGRTNDWSYLLRDGAVREDQVFRRKEEELKFLSTVRIGVRDGALAFPKGLLQGQNLEMELRSLTLEGHDLPSFDALPLPFRCVAVDIGNGSQVVLGKGNLADAIRASMSLPGVFDPVRIDGRELVDGGLLNNIPVDVSRTLGADVLIVVDIGTPLDSEARIANIFSITGQMVAILTEQNVRASRASLQPADVLITPELGDITSADFTRAAESIAIGDRATRQFAERLRAFAVSEAEYAAFRQKQRRPPAPMPRVRSVQIDDNSGYSSTLIETRIGVRPGEVLDLEALRAGAERLYGTDDLERVSFALLDRRDGEADLHVQVEEKEWGPSYVRFGITLESNFRSDSLFTLSGQYNARVFDDLGAELRTRFSVGYENQVLSEYYQPLDMHGTWFVAPRVDAQRRPLNLYEQGQKVAETVVSYGSAGLDGGRQFGNWGELRVGLEGTLGDQDPEFSVGPVPNQKFQDVGARVQVRADTLDDPVFPSRGTLASADYRIGLEGLGADSDYQRLEVFVQQAIGIGEATALLPKLHLTTALSDTVPDYAEPGLGGFLNLSGYARNQFRDQHAALLALIGYHNLAGKRSWLGFPVYVGGSVEAGNLWSTRGDVGDDYVIAGSAFVGVSTPLGPCFLAYGQAEGGEKSVYFFLGPWL